MTVSELIEQLKNVPQDIEVIMSKDGEGNRYSPFSDLVVERYRAESTYEGAMLSEIDKDYYGDEWDFMVAETVPAVFLFPVN